MQISNDSTAIQTWLDLARTDLMASEPLACPNCSATLTSDALARSVCTGCQKPFLEKGWSYGMRRCLWMVLAVLGAIAGIALIVGMFSAAFSTSWPENTPPLMKLIPVLGCFVGIAVVFGFYMFFVTHFAPKEDSLQRILSRLAKQYFKSGDLHGAARFYADLLTYGYNDNFFIDTGRAYDCWVKLGPNVQELAFREPFRDLLFWERLTRHAQQREFGDREHSAPALSYLKELVSVASESERLLDLAKIYRQDRRMSRVGPALTGRFMATNSVSGEEYQLKEVEKELRGKNYPRLASAFGSYL